MEIGEVKKEVEDLLDEIAHRMALPAVRTIASLLRPVLRRVLHGVYVNTDGIAKVYICVCGVFWLFLLVHVV